jgi:hypothetical protein
MSIEIKIDKLITKPIDISKSELIKNKSIVEAKMIKMLTELVMQSK